MNAPQEEVREFDPALCAPAPGNRVVSPADVEDLLPTMAEFGQKQPGIVYDNPEKPGHLCVAAGNRRLLACRILGIKFKAVRYPGPLTPLDIIKIRLTENVLRKAMSPREVAADLEAYMELANATQEEAASVFGMSPATASKLLSLKKLAPDLLPLVDSGQLCKDTARIIAALPTHEQQRELAERAVRLNMKRDAVERAAATMKGKKPAGKIRPEKIKEDGAHLTYPGDWPAAKVVEWLCKLMKRFKQ
jgi:ParB/RepB/Spo0J family partition protein